LRTAVGDAGVSAGVAGIDLDGPAEHPPGELESLLPELVEELPAAEVELVRLHVAGVGPLDGPALFLGEHHPEGAHDVFRDLVLHREDVL